MEIAGAQNGLGARGKGINGINGLAKPMLSPTKKSGGATVNGNVDAQTHAHTAATSASSQATMNSLPPEIVHITTNYFPLPFILQRLAQKSHNDLQAKIEELARMPVGLGATNGTGPGEDNSEENQNKKANLLTFVQDLHSQWVKALVISEWSRKAGKVSKLIDLHAHIMEEIRKYEMMLDRMGNIKRNLYAARLPDPDIKTALQVLSTGQAPFLPDFGFIPPPELSAPEIRKWMNELNVLLSVRLNLDEFDKIPYWFKDFAIANGRVTFKVKGEFAVDLTIADDDFEKQWWFLDFRFAFSPAPEEPSDGLRFFVESKVNESLESRGLLGCYETLHEYVLTHKINALRRQAAELSRRLWVDHTKVESLKRALSIQYWSKRYSAVAHKAGVSLAMPAGPKSWFIVGVNSAKSPPRNAPLGTPSTSHIVIRWFRDGQEVKDEDLSFDAEQISAEALLKRVVGRHTSHILTSIYRKLLVQPRYASRQAFISLNLDNDEPSKSCLSVQMTHKQTLNVRIDAISGSFIFHPQSVNISRRQNFLNTRARDSVGEGLSHIENIRWECLFEEVVKRGSSMGWGMCKRPVHADELKKLQSSRESLAIWLRHESWTPTWYLVVYPSVAGDAWWLVTIIDNAPPKVGPAASTTSTKKPTRPSRATGRHSGLLEQPTTVLGSYNKLPISSSNPDFTNEFFAVLAILTADAKAVAEDNGVLAAAKADHKLAKAAHIYSSSRLKLPALVVGSAVFLGIPTIRKGDKGRNKRKVSWAGDWVEVITRSIRNRGVGRLEVTREARVSVKDMRRVSLLRKGFIDRDVYFDPKARHFRLELRVLSHESSMGLLADRLRAIDRVVDFVASIGGITGVTCESVSLRKVVFTYSDPGSVTPGAQRPWSVTLDLVRNTVVILKLESDSPHVRITDMLEKLINSAVGFEQLPFWLQTTLPLHRALDTIESAWDPVSRNDQGFCEVVPRSIDWVVVQFDLPASTTHKAPRKLKLNINVMNRHGEHWWGVTVDRSGSGEQPDAFDAALRPIFGSAASPKGWQGFEDSAAASVKSGGIEPLLVRTSDIVRAMATGESSATVPSGGSLGAPITLD